LNVELESVSAIPRGRLADEWQALEAVADGSFFLSWTWIGSWLGAVADPSRLRLLRVVDAGAVAALGILGCAPGGRGLALAPRLIKLNESGRPEEDRITIEHNGLLARTADRPRVWRAVIDHLIRAPRLWQALRVGGIADTAHLHDIESAVADTRLRSRVGHSTPYFWVDLRGVREADGGYLSRLSSNTRYQIRRASRLYASDGSLTVSQAEGPEAAMATLDALRALHTPYWEAKGEPGAFASSFARDFHRRLIAAGLPRGEIQLLTLSAQDEPVGYLYNFVYRSRVMSYQSGFRYADDAKRKPGLVCHALAVDHNAALGHDTYDLLMGDSQYKRSLSTHQDQMYWLDVQRPLLRFRLEERLRGLKRRWQQLRQAGVVSEPNGSD
jgi:CelD/BcsL family acetyltransferase involved in cellulose biosynthesis